MNWWHRDNLVWLLFAFDGTPENLPPITTATKRVQQAERHFGRVASRDTYQFVRPGVVHRMENVVGQPRRDGLRVSWAWNEDEKTIRRDVLDATGTLQQTFALVVDDSGELTGAHEQTILEDGSDGGERFHRVSVGKQVVACDYGGEHHLHFRPNGLLSRWENRLRSLTFHYDDVGALSRIVGVGNMHRPRAEQSVAIHWYEADYLTHSEFQGPEYEYTDTFTYAQPDPRGQFTHCQGDDALETLRTWKYTYHKADHQP